MYLADSKTGKRPFGVSYYDFSGIDARLRQADSLNGRGEKFDVTKMPYVPDVTSPTEFDPRDASLTLTGWLIRGAIREDDYTPITIPSRVGPLVVKQPPNPQDDPFRNMDRPLNHFYDPVNDEAIFGGTRAPWWGVGAADPFAQPMQEDTARTNHFTVYDAHEAMYRALTGRAKSGQIVAATQAARMAYWATTFRALGDVMHLIQDMAQPQHTRSDKHSGLGPTVLEVIFTGHGSVYENYIEARATGAKAFSVDIGVTDQNVDIGTPRPLSMAGYDIPRFNRYSDYFTTANLSGVASGVGLADYSNRGFFTSGRNLDDTKYTLPSRDRADYQTVSIQPVAWDGTPINSVTPLYLFKGTVRDTVVPGLTATAVPLTTLSVWNQFLTTRRTRPSYSLNNVNYDAAADLLLPRAVAYSTGLLDYFFRGQMEISLPDAGVFGVVDHAKFAPPATPTDRSAGFVGFDKIRLKLKNTTADITPPAASAIAQDMSGGALVAVLKFHRNLCYTDALDGEITDATQVPECRTVQEEIVVSDVNTSRAVYAGSDPRSAEDLTFTFPRQLPINAWDVVLQVVYRGQLGAEADAVVVATNDISEPTFVAFFNATDYVLLNNAYYMPTQVDADPRLYNELGAACSESNGNGGRRLRSSCYNRSNTFLFRTGLAIKPLTISAQATVQGDQRLFPRRFARIAALVDVTQPPSLRWNRDDLDCYRYLPNPAPIPAYREQQAVLPINGINGVTRGIKGFYSTICSVDVGSVLSSSPDQWDDSVMDLLIGAERFPLPLTIAGWD